MNVHCTYCRLSFDNADPEAFVGLRCKAMFCNFCFINSCMFILQSLFVQQIMIADLVFCRFIGPWI